jgi:hypothetical protein
MAFAASKSEREIVCDQVRFFSGDPEQRLADSPTATIEAVCAPSPATWRKHRVHDLGHYTYGTPGLHTASLRWNDQVVSTPVTPFAASQPTEPTLPEVQLLELIPSAEDTALVFVRTQVRNLAPGYQVRLDAAAGQIRWLDHEHDEGKLREWSFYYTKPGPYTLALDLLDPAGFWLANLAEQSIKILPPDVQLGAPEDATFPDIEALPPVEVPSTAQTDPPWLPYRYCRPLWAWSRTYNTPGGSRISRSLAPGTYLAIQTETLVDGTLWYQSSYGDWIAASAVDLIQPSTLQGVELQTAGPPAPPPPLVSTRQGVVTATRLNVRARPGVVPDNPPIDQLTYGAEVTICEEQSYAGASWYRIGQNRWVHGGWVRVITIQPPPPGFPRQGVVTATRLNVRAYPGVAPDNPPIDQLTHGTEVTIYEERLHEGVPWYRIGEQHWVHSGWIEISENESMASKAPVESSEPSPTPLQAGHVTSPALNVRAMPGVSSDNPPIDQLTFASLVIIYEERLHDGVLWHRIGEDRWVHSGWIDVSEKSPPASTISISRPEDRLALPVGWVVAAALNVRALPGVSSDNPPVDVVLHNQSLAILETRSIDGALWYRIGEYRWVYGPWVAVARPQPRPSAIGSTERWVAVCLSQQTAVAYEGDLPVYAAMVATGLPATPTVQGIFRTWWRVPHRKMSGGSAATGGYFYLEEVPWTCYFYGGYALHAAYWHDAFGRPRSHGCVNMSPYDAWWIYQWSSQSGDSSPAVYVYWE